MTRQEQSLDGCFEGCSEKAAVLLAGLSKPLAAPATDPGMIGDRRRYGLRARFRF